MQFGITLHVQSFQSKHLTCRRCFEACWQYHGTQLLPVEQNLPRVSFKRCNGAACPFLSCGMCVLLGSAIPSGVFAGACTFCSKTALAGCANDGGTNMQTATWQNLDSQNRLATSSKRTSRFRGVYWVDIAASLPKQTKRWVWVSGVRKTTAPIPSPRVFRLGTSETSHFSARSLTSPTKDLFFFPRRASACKC